MEPDRYKNNNKLYIVGIICLVFTLTLFFFSLYIAPYLIWQLNYQMPETVLILLATFTDKYEYSILQSRWLVWSIFFIPSLITGFISYSISNHIENQILNVETVSDEEEKKIASEEVKKQIKESANVGIKIIFLMIAIVLGILFLQYLTQSTI